MDDSSWGTRRPHVVLRALRRLRTLVPAHAGGAERPDPRRRAAPAHLDAAPDLADGIRTGGLVTRPLVALLCLGLALAAGSARFTSAAFTASTAVPTNSLAVDQLSNHFSVASAGAVQAGTSTPVATGNVDSLALDFGTVPSARTFTNVFRITNVGSSS